VEKDQTNGQAGAASATPKPAAVLAARPQRLVAVVGWFSQKPGQAYRSWIGRGSGFRKTRSGANQKEETIIHPDGWWDSWVLGWKNRHGHCCDWWTGRRIPPAGRPSFSLSLLFSWRSAARPRMLARLWYWYYCNTVVHCG